MRSAKELVIVASLMNVTVLALLLATSIQKTRPVVDLRSQEMLSSAQTAAKPATKPVKSQQLPSLHNEYVVDEIDALIEKYEEQTGGSSKNEVKASLALPVGDQKEGGYDLYTIKQGDNPWKIARRHGISFEELIEMNGLDSKKAKNLKIGQQIRVPAKSTTQSISTETAKSKR